MGFLDATYVLGYRPPRSQSPVPGDAAEAVDWHDVRVELMGHPGLRPLHSSGYVR